MKKTAFLLLYTTLLSFHIYGQNQNIGLNQSFGFNPDNDKFIYNGDYLGNYAIGWYSTPLAAEARLSGYDGIKFFTHKLPRLSISINGNVGIGTVSPSSQLDVRSSSNKSIWLNYNNESAITFRPNNSNSWFHVSHGHDNKLYISHGGTVGAGKLMTFVNTGNVGIGTTTPDSKLSVNGNIHTKEVKVDLIGWSDFVFENNYKLPTLKEVEQHIKEKGHLKDIPSAEEVKENGIFLGEMDSKLLQKIEELTLYTIEQQKLIENQSKAIEELKEKTKHL